VTPKRSSSSYTSANGGAVTKSIFVVIKPLNQNKNYQNFPKTI
jgi:hypothetical protein